ncbi:uncharacterized protein LACBIDRAFT_307235 [Laccaria bicolor S238N-H82]|uniref:Golgi apparatus membrane protein TVP38 n=1 Tax=Laccaria bicolor (strain S238N-H82 / ATCC MYA-4686) TaxID=486041 RepID=B0DPQ4_LACBS|nr:uncharacterized protein LACBIDRAFT_307235 [Laccaria bicolor S238N-H82]EDR03489.1 predicted protein [Laccaria bicolor S238N-H82]|eukprot:XP_001885945.1 predicted protein [Laccaria bicolor S238N-H82]
MATPPMRQPSSGQDGYPYPPHAGPYNNDYASSMLTFVGKTLEEGRGTGRTPSPTPSEEKELQSGAINWKAMMTWRFWFRRAWLWYYVIGFILVVITALVTIYHTQIVRWLTPVTQWLFHLRFGWLVPIGVLFVISFPPLFGHEIVAILCGLVWGLWVGFAIVAAGTFLGEVGNFYTAVAPEKRRWKEPRSPTPAWPRFKIALIARLSAIPGHFTTAIFSTCGMGIIVFSIAALLSMPKQFVYMGVILEQSSTGQQDTKSRIISDVVLTITILITIVAMSYILHQTNLVKPEVINARRKAHQGKLAQGFSPYSGNPSESTLAFNPRDSDSQIPLTLTDRAEMRYQQWDKHGKAVGYAGDPSLIIAPKPQKIHLVTQLERDVQESKPSHSREESTDVAGWDLRDLHDDPYGGYVREDSLDNLQTPTQQHPHSSQGFLETSTQARHNLRREPTYPHSSSAFINTSPGSYGHGLETTGASY